MVIATIVMKENMHFNRARQCKKEVNRMLKMFISFALCMLTRFNFIYVKLPILTAHEISRVSEVIKESCVSKE